MDTTVLVGAGDRRDQLHDGSTQILRTVPYGKFGAGLVSDLVLAETATILGRRLGPKLATAYVRGLLDSPAVRCVFLDSTLMDSALRVFQRFGQRLSFTDSATVAIMVNTGCETLFSHDAGFDGIPGVNRRPTI